MPTPRSYSSPLRERQAKQTRELILQALTEQLAEEGLKDFNIPAVARLAGVSIRTIYRYFPTKDILLDAVQDWLDHQVLAFTMPRSVGEFITVPPGLFEMFDQNARYVIAQFATPTGRAVRERGRRQRREALHSALNEAISHLPADEARDAFAIISYLFSAAAWKSLREEFGMSGHESGKAVAWALGTLIEDLKRRNKQAKGR